MNYAGRIHFARADQIEQACKPGSVLNSHLSRRTVAGTLKPPPRGRPGRPICPLHGVAPDRVYSAETLPCQRVSSYLAFPPLPHPQPEYHLRPVICGHKKLTWFRLEDTAVYLCCTCPEVAFGGRYPLSLPCGARTFLTHRLSPCARGCPACSLCVFYPLTAALSTLIERNILKLKCFGYIIPWLGRCA